MPALLLMADIVGYTRFMRLHRLSLAHSEEITRRLLESMLDAVPSMTLVEVEGDALFLYASDGARGEASAASVWPLALDMYKAFHARQQILAGTLCICDACLQIGELRVKFVAHVGAVATQTLGGKENLVGVDVIVVHRMLKNSVPASEYVLISEPLYELAEGELRDRAVHLDQELEGLGTMPFYFVDLSSVPITLPPVPEPTLRARVLQTMRVDVRTLPSMIGLRRLRASHRSPS
jgi:class 3 adenylate cyclase